MTSSSDSSYRFDAAMHWTMTSLKNLTKNTNTLVSDSGFRLVMPDSQSTHNPESQENIREMACARNGNVYALCYGKDLPVIIKQRVGSNHTTVIEINKGELETEIANVVFNENSTIHLRAGEKHLWLIVSCRQLADSISNQQHAHLCNDSVEVVVEITLATNTEEKATQSAVNFKQSIPEEYREQTSRARLLSADVDHDDTLWFLADTGVLTDTITLDQRTLTTDQSTTLFCLSLTESESINTTVHTRLNQG